MYAYIVDCVTDSPYAYSSSTHRFPDERTPRGYASFSDICGAWFGCGSGFGMGFTLLLTRSFTRSPSSRRPPFTQSPFPPRSPVCGGQTSPHKTGWVAMMQGPACVKERERKIATIQHPATTPASHPALVGRPPCEASPRQRWMQNQGRDSRRTIGFSLDWSVEIGFTRGFLHRRAHDDFDFAPKFV